MKLFRKKKAADQRTSATENRQTPVCGADGQSLNHEDSDTLTRMRGAALSSTHQSRHRKLPTVFKWEGGGKQVFLSGSFDNWKSKIPMVRSHNDFFTIVELTEGDHQFKYYVDTQWVCDQHQTQIDNDMGSKNNQITVNSSDFEVFEALAMDSTAESKDGAASPNGEYSQHIPPRSASAGFHHGGPPVLPPHLLQVILNKEIPLHNEPNLLPEPNHVMLNHLYALSIKDGVMVLSATHRYRKKYVTTLLYKPIQ